MCDAPSVILELISDVMGSEQVDQVGMGTIDNKVKAKGLKECLFCSENLAGDFFDFLKRDWGLVVRGWGGEKEGEGRTGPLSGMSRTSIPFALDWHTLATSLSFLPHSSVFVARNMHAAAIV